MFERPDEQSQKQHLIILLALAALACCNILNIYVRIIICAHTFTRNAKRSQTMRSRMVEHTARTTTTEQLQPTKGGRRLSLPSTEPKHGTQSPSEMQVKWNVANESESQLLNGITQ